MKDMVQRVLQLVSDDPMLCAESHRIAVDDLGLHGSFGSYDADHKHPKYELYWARRCEVLMKVLGTAIAELTHFPKEG